MGIWTDAVEARARLIHQEYEAAPDQQPRLVRVEEITVTREASRQLGLELTRPPSP